MSSAIDRMSREVALPGMESELALLFKRAMSEELADEGPVDHDGYRRHTASTLEERRPVAYALIPKLIEEGMGLRGVCRVLNVGPHTVSAVLARESQSQTVSAWRADFSRLLRGNAKLAVARIAELLADDKAVKEAGLKGSTMALRELVKALEMVRDAEKTDPIDTSSAVDAEEANEYMRQLEEESLNS